MYLLIVNFKDIFDKYNPNTGVYCYLTNDEIVLKFDKINKKMITFNDPLYDLMENYFFKEFNRDEYATWQYLNEKFKYYQKFVIDPSTKIDKVVICEV